MDSKIFYPNAHPETTSVDGFIQRGALLQTWAQLRDGVGTVSDSYLFANNGINFLSSNTSAKWEELERVIILFDTSSLLNLGNVIIRSVTLSLYGFITAGGTKNKQDDLGIAPDVNVYSSNPASNTELVPADYGALGTTPFCNTPITYANWKEGWNTFTLNANGIAAISKTGITKFGLRNANYDAANIEPSWSAHLQSYLFWYAADCGLATAPKLTVNYTSIRGLVPGATDIVTLEALRNIEMAVMGRIYVDEQGRLKYESRFARNL